MLPVDGCPLHYSPILVMSSTKFISISSQKGGVGKTTINILAASIFHLLAKERVAVINYD